MCIHFWLLWAFFNVCGLSVVAVSRGYSVVVAHRLPIVEHGL